MSQLNESTLLTFFYFRFISRDQSIHDFDKKECIQNRNLLINCKFLNAYLDHGDESDDKTWIQLQLYWDGFSLSKPWPDKFYPYRSLLSLGKYVQAIRYIITQDYKTLNSIIQLSKLRKLYIYVPGNMDITTAEYLQKLASICGALKKNKSFEVIHLYYKKFESSLSRCLMDILPDKIINMDLGVDYISSLLRRTTIMDCFRFEVHKHNLYYNQIFQIKTRKIEFACDTSWGLWELSECGPLKPNLLLKEIEIHVRFDLQPQYKEAFDTPWEKRYLDKYEKALKLLKTVNPNLILRIHDKETSLDKITSLDDATFKIRRILKNTRLFIDMAIRVGLKIESVFLRNFGLVDLDFPYLQKYMLLSKLKSLNPFQKQNNSEEICNWQDDFITKMGQTLNMKVEYHALTAMIAYKNTKIEILESLIFKAV